MRSLAVLLSLVAHFAAPTEAEAEADADSSPLQPEIESAAAQASLGSALAARARALASTLACARNTAFGCSGCRCVRLRLAGDAPQPPSMMMMMILVARGALLSLLHSSVRFGRTQQ